MLIDHMGLILFPDVEIFRIIGRLAFPIFAFMIAEGCRYTKNKLRHFLMIFILGLLCQIVYIVDDPKSGLSYMGILITFSFSIGVIYALQLFKKLLLAEKKKPIAIISSAILLIASIFTVYVFNSIIELDYGFFGAMLPVFASIFMFEPKSESKIKKMFDKTLFTLPA